MSNSSTKKLVLTALVAAVYVTTTRAWPMSYSEIQFRISEVMVLLAFIDPSYLPGLVLGTFIANLLGPFGIVDAVVGSFHTFVGVFMIIKSRNLLKNKTGNLLIASLWPAVFSFIIAAMIYYTTLGTEYATGFWYAYLTVAIGELVVITGIGVPLFKYIMSKPQWIENLRISIK